MVKAGYGRGLRRRADRRRQRRRPDHPAVDRLHPDRRARPTCRSRGCSWRGSLPGLLYSLGHAGRRLARSAGGAAIRSTASPPGGDLAAFRAAFWALLMPVLIVVGIRSGIFNVTECSAVAVLYALFVGVVIYRELTPRADRRRRWSRPARTTAMIMIVIGGAQIVVWLLAYENVPQQLADAMLAASRNPLGLPADGQRTADPHRDVPGERAGAGDAGPGPVSDRGRRSASIRSTSR